MKALIVKDFKLLKFFNMFAVLASIIFGYIGVSYENIIKSKFSYIFATMIISYMASMFLSNYDKKASSDIAINSLPINRLYVVKSKYIFMILYILISSLLVFISSNLSRLIFSSSILGTPANIFDVLFIIGLPLLFFSIYLPIHYFNIDKSQAINQIFYMLFILSPALLSKIGDKYGLQILNSSLFKYFSNLNFSVLISMFAFISLILYIFSLSISRKIYEAKEF